MTRVRHSHRLASIPLVAGLLFLLGSACAQAVDPQLQRAIERGRENFAHNTFGGPGRVCEGCHLGGGMRPGRRPDGAPIPSLSSAATIFPRISEDDHRLITLSDQVRICVAGGIKGKAPAYGSDELNSLVAYVTSLAQGKAIEMGADFK